MNGKYSADPRDVQDNKVMAILAYLGPLVLVPILAAKDSPFARYHANQGLILCIGWVACWIALTFLQAIFPWSLWAIFSLLWGALGLGTLVFAVLGIINAANGEMKELPLIGKFTILK